MASFAYSNGNFTMMSFSNFFVDVGGTQAVGNIASTAHDISIVRNGGSWKISNNGINGGTPSDLVNSIGAAVSASDKGVYFTWPSATKALFEGSSFGDEISAGSSADTIRGLDGNDTLSGGAGADSLEGGAGNDFILGDNGNDTLLGGDGNDTFFSGTGNDSLDGGAGDDRIRAEGGADTISGGDGADTVLGSAAELNGVTIADFSSGETITVTGANLSSLNGTTASGTVSLGAGLSMTLSGITSASGTFNAVFSGGNTTITLTAPIVIPAPITPAENPAPAITTNTPNVVSPATYGDYADILGLGDANDSVLGMGGNDSIAGNVGADTLFGNAGNDSLSGGVDRDVLYGGRENDLLLGNDDDDILFGNLDSDTLIGGNGADFLYGGKADDVLFGGDGIDFMSGDLGNDTLTGDAGADVFNASINGGQDVITDFDFVTGDRIGMNGQTYTATTGSGGFALLTLSGGGSILLSGHTLSEVSANWFI